MYGIDDRATVRKQTRKRAHLIAEKLRGIHDSTVIDQILDADPALRGSEELRAAVRARIEEIAPALRKDREAREAIERLKREEYRWWTVTAWREPRAGITGTWGLKLGPLTIYGYRAVPTVCWTWFCGRERVAYPRGWTTARILATLRAQVAAADLERRRAS